MDILIKNFEMPKSCITGKLPDYEYCPFFGVCSKVSAKTERPSDCPLVELPPHEELVQRSDILRLFDENKLSAREAVMKAPAIVEASI